MLKAIFKNIIFFITLMWPMVSFGQYEELLQEGFDQIIKEDKVVYFEHQALRNAL